MNKIDSDVDFKWDENQAGHYYEEPDHSIVTYPTL